MTYALKMQRALEHLDCIDDKLRVWLKANSHATNFPIKVEAAEGQERHRIFYMGDAFPVDEVGLMVGDAVQNMRQALDHLVYELSVSFTPGLTEDEAEAVQFPVIWKGPNPREEARRLAHVCPCAKAAIKAMQPYLANDYEETILFRINELARIDRHRLIHTVTSLVTPIGITGHNWRMLEMESLQPMPYEGGAEVFTALITPLDPARDMHVEFHPAHHIAFADYPAEAEELYPTLSDLYWGVREFAAPLEKFLLQHTHMAP